MGIKIEIDTERMAEPEWRALSAFVAMFLEPESCDTVQASRFDKYAPDPATLIVRADSPGQGITLEKLQATIHPADNPATGADTDAALQSAGFGVGNAAGGAGVPAVTIAPPVPPVTLPAPPVTATAPAPSAGVQLDKRGLPWDHRIHSGEKTQTKDGSWRNKRNLPDGEVERVEAELRAVMGVAALAPLNPMVPPPSPPGAMGFMQLLPKVTGAIKAGTLTQDAVNAALVEFSLPNLPAIHHRPDLVQAFHDRLFGGA